MISPNPIRIRFAAAATVVASIFLYFAGDGLAAYFTPDDMMNLYGAWFRPLLEADRPLGALVYRLLFALFGWNPAPFRVACFLLLFANLGLLYGFCRRLSGSREVAALACLLGAYHAHLADLYYSTGTIYDLLCGVFYLSAFLVWARLRDGGRIPGAPGSAAVLALYACALASKEMAVTLPLLMLAYALLYHPPGRTAAGTRQWLWRETRLLAPAVLVTAAFLLWKFAGPHTMIDNPDYRPEFTLRAFLTAWRHYAFDLFYGAVPFTGAGVVLLLAALPAVAALARRREMFFALVVICGGILPVAFIVPRGFFVAYLTLPGWYLYGASLLAAVRDALLGPGARPGWVFAMVACLLIPLHQRQKPLGKQWVEGAHAAVHRVAGSLDAVAGPLPRHAAVLFLSDPYEADDYILTFIFRLHYRDDGIRVDRVRGGRVPPGAARPASYYKVFRLDGGVLTAQP